MVVLDVVTHQDRTEPCELWHPDIAWHLGYTTVVETLDLRLHGTSRRTLCPQLSNLGFILLHKLWLHCNSNAVMVTISVSDSAVAGLLTIHPQKLPFKCQLHKIVRFSYGLLNAMAAEIRLCSFPSTTLLGQQYCVKVADGFTAEEHIVLFELTDFHLSARWVVSRLWWR